jgi:class 3 adenylate cyclase
LTGKRKQDFEGNPFVLPAFFVKLEAPEGHDPESESIMGKKKRQLAAIMFTDIVGYSRVMQVDEEKAALIRKRHREIFREKHERQGGKILQYYGDGTLSIFDSAVAAVECAVEMQQEFRAPPRVPLRIGIHTGDITYEDEGAYGDGLNIAARIEPLCTPGGVFISGKVYDDIKNHPWLKAVSLGYYKLKNILHEVEIYAVTSRGLPVPEGTGRKRDLPFETEPEASNITGDKNRKTAAILALLLGIFGAHRFYLGQRRRGIAHLIFATIGILSLDGGGSPFLPVLAIIAVIDAVLFFTMSDEAFDQKYNVEERERAPAHARESVYERSQEPSPNPYKKSGVRKFRAGHYEEALADFLRALEHNPEDMAVHFNLACCYSLQKEVQKSLYHLGKAVEYGFWDFEKIHEHEALEYVRSTEAFDSFVANDYRPVQELPSPQEDLLESQPSKPDLLDQIANLGELMEKGVITREEFDEQKRKLLDGE